MTDENRNFRITAVCLGNICRSPIAEVVISEQLHHAGLSHLTTVESGGTAGWHEGNPADPRTIAALARAGYPISHRARMFTDDWFETSDLILGMDYQNVLDVRALTTDPAVIESIRPIRSFDPNLVHLPEDDPSLEVPDPYHGTDADFDGVVRMVESATAGIVDYVRLRV